MYCKKCGTQNQDGAGFCKSCGTPLRQPSAPSRPAAPTHSQPDPYAPPQGLAQSSQPNPAQPPQTGFGQPQQNFGQPAQNIYAPPQNFATATGGYGRGSSPLARLNLFHWIAMALLLLTFIGMFTPWLGVKYSYNVKANGRSQSDTERDNSSFFDLFDDDDDDSTTLMGKDYSKEIDKLETRKNLMKWFGLAGFIVAAAAIGLAFVNPKLLLCISAVSAACFTVAFIATILEASLLNDTIEDAFDLLKKQYSGSGIDFGTSIKCSPHFGVIFAFICSVAATVMATIGTFIKKKPKATTNAYGMGSF